MYEETEENDFSELFHQQTLEGTVLCGRYQITGMVASGQTSTLYAAHDIKEEGPVCLKVLVPPYCSASGIRALEREARILGCLSHPNIISVQDMCVSSEGLVFLVFEYVDSSTLGELLTSSDVIGTLHFAQIFWQVCSALQHAHERGIVHADLNPGKILVERTDEHFQRVKLAGFGGAVSLRHDDTNADWAEHPLERPVGRSYYRSPEQCSGAALDARTDVYSLGCIMYESLTNTMPFRGRDVLETMRKHKSERPLSFARIRPDLAIPCQLEALVMRALSKRPGHRFQSMHEIQMALERLAPRYEERWLDRLKHLFGL